MIHDLIPCIIKNDAVSRGLTNDIIKFLSNSVRICSSFEFSLYCDEVWQYKNIEWASEKHPIEPFLQDLIFHYEASDVVIVMIDPSGKSFEELTIIKGTSVLPINCSYQSIRGHFADQGQTSRLVKYNERILELLPNGQLGCPRNIFHVPDSYKSASILRDVVLKRRGCLQ